MDFPASVKNMLVTFFVVLASNVAAWNIPEVQFLAGLMTGVWLGSMHNVLWGWFTRRASFPNAEVRHARADNPTAPSVEASPE